MWPEIRVRGEQRTRKTARGQVRIQRVWNKRQGEISAILILRIVAISAGSICTSVQKCQKEIRVWELSKLSKDNKIRFRRKLQSLRK